MEQGKSINKDEALLNKLGYKQELNRSLSSFRNFCLCFTTMSLLSGLTPLYGTALMTGGPVVIIFGWIFVTLMTLTVALSMSEVCSSLPTSGGLYYWAASLSTPRWSPIAAYFTGMFNLIGQIAGTASVNFGLALIVVGTISVGTDTQWSATPGATVGIYIAILFLQGLLNTFGTRAIGMMNVISLYWHLFGTLGIIISILVCTRNSPASAKFVFTDFENHSGWNNSGFAVLLGLLQSQYSFTGYDSAAHMTEETKNAQRAGPISILTSILMTSGLGLAYLLAVTFSIQDYDQVINTKTGIPTAQVFLDALGKTGALIVLCVIIVAVFFCGNAGVTSNSRLIYALARDKALPFSGTLYRLHKKTQTPVIAAWAILFIAALLGLISIGSETAFVAITSVCTISLYITYGFPTLCLLLNRSQFTPGPFTLGRFSTINGIVALCWIVLISVLFILPTEYPVEASNMNYAIVIFGGLWIIIAIYWFTRGRHVFKGPVRYVNSSDATSAMEGDDDINAFDMAKRQVNTTIIKKDQQHIQDEKKQLDNSEE
ncbi:APC amino acid permease [Halteromyces radiatus]|uniref:APC amino acid permease n=1 Tax=Halteromyces radiatus TaxID=101107 RepID=UPI00221F4706|nr:APC amino acid permease [Halteromyces radiatus]KAI8092527.1 APC amino acid permease [Halteromyces radiatus]